MTNKKKPFSLRETLKSHAAKMPPGVFENLAHASADALLAMTLGPSKNPIDAFTRPLVGEAALRAIDWAGAAPNRRIIIERGENDFVEVWAEENGERTRFDMKGAQREERKEKP